MIASQNRIHIGLVPRRRICLKQFFLNILLSILHRKESVEKLSNQQEKIIF